jgi:hypothetical protein
MLRALDCGFLVYTRIFLESSPLACLCTILVYLPPGGGGGARFSAAVWTCFGDHPTSCIVGTGVKGPELGVDHPPSCSAEVKQRVELYLLPPLCAFMAR